MRADGDREALRLLMTGRDHAVASCKSARTALAAVLVTAPAPLREQLRHLPRERRARACAALDCPPGADRQTRVLHQTLARLGQRIAGLTRTAAGIEAQITAIAGDMTPGLVAAEPDSAPCPPRRSCCPGPTPAASAAKQHSPCSQAPPRSPSPPAAPIATASTASATASSTEH
jgi:hypothetical protein